MFVNIITHIEITQHIENMSKNCFCRLFLFIYYSVRAIKPHILLRLCVISTRISPCRHASPASAKKVRRLKSFSASASERDNVRTIPAMQEALLLDGVDVSFAAYQYQ